MCHMFRKDPGSGPARRFYLTVPLLLPVPLRSLAGWSTLSLSQGHLHASLPVFSPLRPDFGLPLLAWTLDDTLRPAEGQMESGQGPPRTPQRAVQAGRKICSGGKKREVQQAQLVLLAKASRSPVFTAPVMSACARAPLGPPVPLPPEELGGWALPHLMAGISDPRVWPRGAWRRAYARYSWTSAGKPDPLLKWQKPFCRCSLTPSSCPFIWAHGELGRVPP